MIRLVIISSSFVASSLLFGSSLFLGTHPQCRQCENILEGIKSEKNVDFVLDVKHHESSILDESNVSKPGGEGAKKEMKSG